MPRWTELSALSDQTLQIGDLVSCTHEHVDLTLGVILQGGGHWGNKVFKVYWVYPPKDWSEVSLWDVKNLRLISRGR